MHTHLSWDFVRGAGVERARQVPRGCSKGEYGAGQRQEGHKPLRLGTVLTTVCPARFVRAHSALGSLGRARLRSVSACVRVTARAGAA